MIDAALVCARRLHGDDRGRKALGDHRFSLGGRLLGVLGEGDDAHAQRQLAHRGDVLIDMQADDAGAALDGLHAVLRADDDRLGAEGEHQRAGEQHGADHAVHLRHLVRQQHKAHEDVDQITLVHAAAQRFGGVHGQWLAGNGAAARVQNAAHAVAARVEHHQGIQVFTDVAFFQIVTFHSCYRPSGRFALIIVVTNRKCKRN